MIHPEGATWVLPLFFIYLMSATHSPIPRTKKEIVRDVEQTREEIRQSLASARISVTQENAVVRTWKKTRAGASAAARRISEGTRLVVTKVKAGDAAVRHHPYRTIFIGLAAGLAVGFFMGWKNRRQKPDCSC